MRPNHFYIVAVVALIVAACTIISCAKDLDCDTCPCPACPRVDLLIPNGGIAGDTIILVGANFSSEEGQNAVKFNGLAAEVVGTLTADTIRAVVPFGVTTGPVTIKAGDYLESVMIPDYSGPVFTVLGAATRIVAGSIATSGSNAIDGLPGTGQIDSITSMVPAPNSSLLIMDGSPTAGNTRLRRVALNTGDVSTLGGCSWNCTSDLYRFTGPAPSCILDPNSNFIYTLQVQDSFAIAIQKVSTSGGNCNATDVWNQTVGSTADTTFGESVVTWDQNFLYLFTSGREQNDQGFQLMKTPIGGGDILPDGAPGPFNTFSDWLHVTDMQITAGGDIYFSTTCADADQSAIFRRQSGGSVFEKILYVQNLNVAINGIAVTDNTVYFSQGNEIRKITGFGSTNGSDGTSEVIAGSDVAGSEVGIGSLLNARFRKIGDIDVVGTTMYVADYGNHVIRAFELPQ